MNDGRPLNWPAVWLCHHCRAARTDLYLRSEAAHEEGITFCGECDPEPWRPRVNIIDAAFEAWPDASEDDVGSRIEFALACGPQLGVWDGSAWRNLDEIMTDLLAAAERLLRWYQTSGIDG